MKRWKRNPTRASERTKPIGGDSAMEMSRELSHRYFPARLPGPRDPRVTVEHITRRPTRPRSPSRVWSLGGGGGERKAFITKPSPPPSPTSIPASSPALSPFRRQQNPRRGGRTRRDSPCGSHDRKYLVTTAATALTGLSPPGCL